MTSPFAPASAAALPVHVLAPDRLEGFLAGPGAAHAAWVRANGFTGKLGEILVLPGVDGMAGALAGFGTANARARQRFGLSRALSALPAGDWQLSGDLAARDIEEATLGWLLSRYRFDRYRSPAAARPQARLVIPQAIDSEQLRILAEGEFLTRDLINTPAEDMGPAELEAAFRALAEEFSAEINVITGEDLLAQNLPMIHAVGRAAPRAPRLLDLRWGNTGPRLTLVGKGVCFDTGGLDIKPSASMLLMKKDMGGAATAMGLARMIMSSDLQIRLRLLVPAVENSISGNALRPRDILRSRKGLTVEVNNTDAEGRLVLADALTLATEEETDLVISMATLTGAARVAVGPDIAPFFATEDRLARALEHGAEAGFDPVWRLPFHEAYESMIEPGIADLDNAPSGGMAGAITAALFLRRFADHPRYMHFDIYGHNPADAPGRPKGGAGQGARALFHALPHLLRP